MIVSIDSSAIVSNNFNISIILLLFFVQRIYEAVFWSCYVRYIHTATAKTTYSTPCTIRPTLWARPADDPVSMVPTRPWSSSLTDETRTCPWRRSREAGKRSRLNANITFAIKNCQCPLLRWRQSGKLIVLKVNVI